jgi:hypothetical protein
LDVGQKVDIVKRVGEEKGESRGKLSVVTLVVGDGVAFRGGDGSDLCRLRNLFVEFAWAERLQVLEGCKGIFLRL